MSGVTVADFIAYWEHEGQAYVRRRDYEWMASLVPGERVLEIGCGVGFATQALVNRGLAVLALDNLDECLAATRDRLDGAEAILLKADLLALTAAQRAQIEAFSPDTVVCWLMGAPAETIGAKLGDGGTAVATYREKTHRALAVLATSLPGVRAIHYVDRTAIPWQAKDIGRDTLVRYHQGKTLLDLPFVVARGDALYRKLGDNVIDLAQVRKPHPALHRVVPTLASLLAKRRK